MARGRGGGKGRGGRPRTDDTATLPAQLLDTLDNQKGTDAELDQRFGFRGFQKTQLSRKEDRKRQRNEKQQRKREHFSTKKSSVAPSEQACDSQGIPLKRKSDADLPTQSTKKQKTTTPPPSVPRSSVAPKSKPAAKPLPAPNEASEARKLAKLAASNPHFYSLLKEQNLISGGPAATVSTQKAAFDQDDKEIEMYARKLGLHKKKGKNKGALGKAFTEDGLDELFAGLAGDSIEKTAPKPVSSASDGQHDKSGASDDEGDDFGMGGMDEDEDDDEDDFGMSGFDEEEEDESDDMGSHGDDVSGEGSLDGSDDESMMEMDLAEEGSEATFSGEDDEEMSLSDEVGGSESGLGSAEEDSHEPEAPATSVSDTAPATKYIPPHLRPKPTSQSEQYLRMKRQLQGHLNRLSDANMESIVAAVDECLVKSSRHDIVEILTDLITTIIADHANLLDSFVMTYAAFIAALYNTIGMEFGAHLVQTVVEMLDKSRQDWLKAAKNDVAEGAGLEEQKEQEKEMRNKKCVNLVTLLGYLYDFEVVACVIIYDIIRLAIAEMSELDVELLLRLIRISGFQLRSDDPSSLKEIVLMVQEGIAKRDPTTVSTRAKFMVETIMDLKNNKRKAQKKNAQNDLQMDRLKKFVGNLGKKRGGVSNEALR
ncbi:suppressor of glycerol defect, partial [Rhizophlyctis rosea]